MKTRHYLYQFAIEGFDLKRLLYLEVDLLCFDGCTDADGPVISISQDLLEGAQVETQPAPQVTDTWRTPIH